MLYENVEPVQELPFNVGNNTFLAKSNTSMGDDFQKCEDFTASEGYRCVSNSMCQDGMDGWVGIKVVNITMESPRMKNLNNSDPIENGFVNPKEGKWCPEDHQICCKDPDFVATSGIIQIRV